MQTMVPKGRANYEPNSLAAHGEEGGPRESAMAGFAGGCRDRRGRERRKLRVRSETFADHYSQARMFYLSQTPSEQAHIASAFVFELSKVGLLDQVPPRMVANLRNVDEDLARRVARAWHPLPPKTRAAKEPIDMPPSDALSIHKNMKETLEGRAVGILIADGTDAAVLDAVIGAVKGEGQGRDRCAQGGRGKAERWIGAQGRRPARGIASQIFDAVAIVLSDDGCAALLKKRRPCSS
jgi:catalase